jgi:hypothetical protein
VSDARDKVNYLKKLYREIVLGFSVFEYAGKPIFIKHFTEVDNGEQESERVKWEKIGREKGLLDKEEKSRFLIQSGLWSREKEDEIEKTKREISDQELLIKNLFIQRQVQAAKEKMRKANEKLKELNLEKDDIFGLCLEDFIHKKGNELTIYNSFFIDKELTQKLFTEEEFDRLPEKDLGELIRILNDFYLTFNYSQIKRISVCSFFVNLFNLCSDNAFDFYGKRIVDLTILQINLFAQGKYFKNLIQSRGDKAMPPSDVLEDPDKMIEWYDQLSDEASHGADGVSYVGATKEELKKLAGSGAIDMQEFAKKKGNSMSTKDFIEMHGI